MKRAKKDIEKWLINYPEMRIEAQVLRSEYSSLACAVGDGMPRGGAVSDPTSRKALNLLYISSLEEQVMVVQLTERDITYKHKALLAARRQAAIECIADTPGRPEWVDFCRAYLVKEIGFMPDERTMRWWWRDITETAMWHSLKRGVLGK